MRVYEVPIDMTPEGKLELPDALMDRMVQGQNIRLIALVDESEDDKEYDSDWSRVTAEQFLAGYSDSDSIYDTIE